MRNPNEFRPSFQLSNIQPYILIFTACLALTCIIWAGYFLFVESWIREMYKGHSVLGLPQIISGQSSHGVDYYLSLARSLLSKYTVVLWVIVSCLGCITAIKKYFGWLSVMCIALGTLVLSEIVLLYISHHPNLLKMLPGMMGDFQRYYLNYQRHIIQVEPACAEYDAALTYRLKPGECDFSNVEFHNHYQINSAGFRDDEKSLDGPRIVVLGDSYAMGWGVEQDETYAQLLEKKLGEKVLNAGTPSYGTAREIMSLNKIDTTHLKYLIIGYNSGDDIENKSYFVSGNTLPISTREKYGQAVTTYQNLIKYFPGKMVLRFFTGLFEVAGRCLMPGEMETVNVEMRSSQLFLNVLMNGTKKNLDGVQIIVMEHVAHCQDGYKFINLVKEDIKNGDYPDYIKNMKFIDLTGKLSAEKHCFVLDDHINSAGHEVVAAMLYDSLRLDSENSL